MYSYPKRIAIILALVVSLIIGVAQVIDFKVDTIHYYLIVIAIMLFVFLIIYIVIYYSLNNFIIQKIKPIYKSIRNIDVADKELYETVENRDVISDVNDQVYSWALKEKQQIKELREQSKYRKEFLGNVSHELKTPIFNIQGYISTLLDGGLEDTNINRLYLERTDKNINRIISIVEDLSTITKLESGELKLRYENFNLTKLIEEVFEMYEIKAKKRNVELKLTAGTLKNIFVYADRKGISQVFSNLIENSIKYGKVNGFVSVEFFDMDKNYLIEVSDNGIGIDENNLPRIFERFYRVDKHRSRDQGGTGLGLSIVKHIIDAHNQTLNVRSRANKGTSFAFTLKKAK
jgi:two-component system, OmpR family, phosphate regulon sensor histidine kinase PhoR